MIASFADEETQSPIFAQNWAGGKSLACCTLPIEIEARRLKAGRNGQEAVRCLAELLQRVDAIR